MRDKNLSFIQFVEQLEKYLVKKLILPRLLRTAVINSPTFLENFNLRYPRKAKELFAFSIIHYYLPEYLMWRVHLDLLELSLSSLNTKQRIEILIVLNSKEDMLKYLYRTKRYSSHEIFGNVLKDGLRVTRLLQVFQRSTLVIKAKRKRGYDDKGSLRPKEKWLPDFDISFTELQQKKEKKTDLQQKSINRCLKSLREPKED